MLVISELDVAEIERVDLHLPLHRLDQTNDESTYLVAWLDGQPAGHARIAWTETHLGVPEIQDVFVAPEHRRKGLASALTEAAEAMAEARGSNAISLSVSRDKNPAARALYRSLGYRPADSDLIRVTGVITLRGKPVAVDDTLMYMIKSL